MATKRQRRVPARQDSHQNRLLAQFPADVYRRIAPELEPVSLQIGQALCEVGDRVKYLYFPSKNAMLSLLVTSGDASAVEVGVTGWEGFAGFAPLLGADASPHQVRVRVPGAARRIDARAMRAVVRDGADVRGVLLRYVQAMLSQISQTALCSRVHSVEEPLARWGLVNQGRTDHNHLPM